MSNAFDNLNGGAGFRGFQDADTAGTEFGMLFFMITSLINRGATATLVQVQGVTNAGGVAPVGTVDILPLVNQIDGAWNAIPHGVIYKCPYHRIQGGGNAIILDPQIGDIGIALFADHDISSVIANRENISGIIAKDQEGNPSNTVNPGSRRRFDMADGLYLGGVLNGVPTQFVEFSAAGIRMHSPVMLTFDAPNILMTTQSLVVNASVSVEITTPTMTVTGNLVTTGTLTNNTKDVGSAHKHSGVSTGINNTGAPI